MNHRSRKCDCSHPLTFSFLKLILKYRKGIGSQPNGYTEPFYLPRKGKEKSSHTPQILSTHFLEITLERKIAYSAVSRSSCAGGVSLSTEVGS